MFLLNQYLADPSTCFRAKGGDGVEVCGHEISSLLISCLGFRNSREILHSTLLDMVPINEISTEKVRKFVETATEPFLVYHGFVPFNEEFFTTSNLALNVLGVSDTGRSPNDYDNCSAIYDRILTTYNVKSSDILLDECKAPIQFSYRDSIVPLFKSRNMQLIDVITLQELKNNLSDSKIPFFLYSGSHDCMVPKDLFQNEVKTLGKLVTYYNFTESGHEGFMAEDRVIRDLAN